MYDLKKKKKKGENIKIANVSKKLGDMWKKLSDKDKVKYNNLSNADKKRYESEMEEYSQ